MTKKKKKKNFSRVSFQKKQNKMEMQSNIRFLSKPVIIIENITLNNTIGKIHIVFKNIFDFRNSALKSLFLNLNFAND